MRKVTRSQKLKSKQTEATFKLLGFSALGLTALVFVTILSYHLAYYQKIYPGIKIGGINVGNKTTTEAKALLSKASESLAKNGLALSIDNEVTNYSTQDVDLKYDFDQSVANAYQIGRHPNLVTSVIQKVVAWNQYYSLQPHVSWDEAKLEKILTQISSKKTKPPKEVQITYNNSTVQLSNAEDGQRLNELKSHEQILRNLVTFSVSPIILEMEVIKTKISQQQAQEYLGQIQALIATPITLTYQNQKWELKDKELAETLTFEQHQNSSEYVFKILNHEYTIEKTNVISRTTEPALALDPKKLQDFVDRIGNQINQDPVNAKFNFVDGKILGFIPHRDGQKLDENETISQITTVFANNTADKTIRLKVAVSPAQITTESVNNLGIKELIGSGTSRFAGSIPNRIANVGLAANRVNGTLVAPGEVFSMYKTIGEVDASTGYKEAYIISKGRTQLDFGGGVCQVSTTLFRAALNTGLPIMERHPHAYRVGYYEQNSPPGIDASVFFPYSDFKFKNDTSHHILIQTKFNAATTTLTFEFYGTRDGRIVNLTKPTITGQTPAPPPLHQDDPTLPAGTVKQVDFAAAGATTTFYRTVTKDGVTIAKDTFFSKYRPWQAVFLHGTKPG